MTFGLASKHSNLRLSRRLRSTRKLFSSLTGFHGLLSGKRYYESINFDSSGTFGSWKMESSPDQNTGKVKNPTSRFRENSETSNDATNEAKLRELFELEEEEKRFERVKTIDRLIAEGQERLQHLICEKDVLQRRPNPLYHYSSESALDSNEVQANVSGSSIDQTTSRQFEFPPNDLVDEYLEMIFWSRRLIKVWLTEFFYQSY